MRVGQWMTKEPLTIGPKESIVPARSIMRQRRIRRLPAVEGDRLVGIAWMASPSSTRCGDCHLRRTK